MATRTPPDARSGLTAGAAAIWWNKEVSSTQWFKPDDPADELDEEGPDEDAVSGDARRPWPDAEHEEADAEEAQSRRDDVETRHRAHSQSSRPVCWLAAPSQVNSSGEASARDKRQRVATRSLPASHNVRETGRTRKMVEPSSRLFGSRSADLSDCHDRQDHGHQQERHTEIGVSAGRTEA